MAEAKRYRDSLREDRFRLFELRAGQSDLLVGVDRASWDPALAFGAARALAGLRAQLGAQLEKSPSWGRSWAPLPADGSAPPVVRAMDEAAGAACVGPMAAVAGAVADCVLDWLAAAGAREAFVENGGDCAILAKEPFVTGLWPGDAVFSGRLAMELPAGRWGVAGSSGRLGHSASLGRADLCAAVAVRCSLADAWATRGGNMVGGPDEVEDAAALAGRPGGPLAVFAAAGGRAAYRGPFPLVPALESGRQPSGRSVA